MKRITKLLFALCFIFTTVEMNAQLTKDSWSLGAGGTYPRFIGVWVGATKTSTDNYGAFLSIKRNFSEHIGVRFLANYLRFGYFYRGNSVIERYNVKLFSGNADMLYYFVPCEPISPYVSFGFGGMLFTPQNAPQPELEETKVDYQFNLGFGAEWTVGNDFKVTTELNHRLAATNDLDGENLIGGDKGLFGSKGESYMSFDLGVQYYFLKGEPSKYCQLYTGITVEIPKTLTADEVEEIVKKYVPDEVVKEVIIGKPVETVKDRWTLVGVNFDFNKAKLKTESFPILYHTIKILNENPDMVVEIGGHTDNIGSESYNQMLSELRAQMVKDYLISKGIASEKLIVKGYGKSQPIADNSTDDGRMLNRRIEFQVLK